MHIPGGQGWGEWLLGMLFFACPFWEDCWQALHGSLPKRVALFPGRSRWEFVGPAVQSAQSEVGCAFPITAHPHTNCPLTDQLTLPLCHGGLVGRTPFLWRATPPSSPLLPPPRLPCELGSSTDSVAGGCGRPCTPPPVPAGRRRPARPD
jgi:hypothetical protein